MKQNTAHSLKSQRPHQSRPHAESTLRLQRQILRQIADRQKQLSQTWGIVQYLLKYWPECTIDAIIGFDTGCDASVSPHRHA